MSTPHTPRSITLAVEGLRVEPPLRVYTYRVTWWDPAHASHGPWHRDAKHVARLVHEHHARVVARLLARPADAVHEPAATSGTVHEGVVVT